MKKSFRLGIIDAGSNSIKLQIVETKDGNCSLIDEYKVSARIGDDCFRTGYISGESKEKLFKAFNYIKKIIELNKTDTVKAVGTAVFRHAKNKKEIASEIKQTCGIDLNIISGEEEARLSYLAVSSNFSLNKSNSVIADIGGGSTEITLVDRGEILQSYSTPLGCLRLKNDFSKERLPYNLKIPAMKTFIKNSFKDFPNQFFKKAICTGGTVNNLAAVYCGFNGKKADSRINYVPKSFLKDFIDANKNSSADDIKKIKSADAGRADIIIPAAVILYEMLTYFHLQGFYSFSGGLRNGLLMDELNKKGVTMTATKKHEKSYETDFPFAMYSEIGKKFNFDEKHSKQVAYLSEKLFYAFEESYGISKEYLKYLIAAAMLHDIGNFVSMSKHHKHSLYLIKNIDLAGFSDYEKAIIANIARYHRKSPPKKHHDIYKDIREGDIDAVIKLASILRVADALDREHKGNIEDIKPEVTDKIITLNPVYKGDILLEVESLETKKDLMEKITGKYVFLNAQ
ncbi:MAG: Ppx/GppA family phosphatase [Deltaproteobacteria bacterium]|jgi:exopolyphosphatase/guanosine-5'-triphosphate,3'-diphosphate pyrophosphatase|nr:Ppx/GppA family phosphatase [Deltaproteobacteria bacterium]